MIGSALFIFAVGISGWLYSIYSQQPIIQRTDKGDAWADTLAITAAPARRPKGATPARWELVARSPALDAQLRDAAARIRASTPLQHFAISVISSTRQLNSIAQPSETMGGWNDREMLYPACTIKLAALPAIAEAAAQPGSGWAAPHEKLMAAAYGPSETMPFGRLMDFVEGALADPENLEADAPLRPGSIEDTRYKSSVVSKRAAYQARLIQLGLASEARLMQKIYPTYEDKAPGELDLWIAARYGRNQISARALALLMNDLLFGEATTSSRAMATKYLRRWPEAPASEAAALHRLAGTAQSSADLQRERLALAAEQDSGIGISQALRRCDGAAVLPISLPTAAAVLSTESMALRRAAYPDLIDDVLQPVANIGGQKPLCEVFSKNGLGKDIVAEVVTIVTTTTKAVETYTVAALLDISTLTGRAAWSEDARCRWINVLAAEGWHALLSGEDNLSTSPMKMLPDPAAVAATLMHEARHLNGAKGQTKAP